MRIAPLHVRKPSRRQTSVNADGIFWKQFEISAIAAAGLGSGSTAFQDHYIQIGLPEVISRGSSRKATSDNDDIGLLRKVGRTLVSTQRVGCPVPKGQLVDRQSDGPLSFQSKLC